MSIIKSITVNRGHTCVTFADGRNVRSKNPNTSRSVPHFEGNFRDVATRAWVVLTREELAACLAFADVNRLYVLGGV